jgi:hypothetical protein
VRDSLDRSLRGFNLFLKENRAALLAIMRGEFAINGLSNNRLRALPPKKSSGQVARNLLKCYAFCAGFYRLGTKFFFVSSLASPSPFFHQKTLRALELAG